ncbi:MAG: hypothetical protein J5850_03360 [Clostridia bacterium]|nr:hypothetical protein [Clostridia bacterium]
MKKIITLALALVMVLAIALPVLAEDYNCTLTEADGVWTAADGHWLNAQAFYTTSNTSKHFKVEADFFTSPKGDGDNGCTGFMLTNADDMTKAEANGICILFQGSGTTWGFTSRNHWWGKADIQYTATENHVDHMAVEFEVLSETTSKITITINGGEPFVINSGDLAASYKDPDGDYTGFTSIVLVEKITNGTVKNVQFTDLEETVTPPPAGGEGGNKETGAASIVIAMTALVSLAAVTVVAKKRH